MTWGKEICEINTEITVSLCSILAVFSDCVFKINYLLAMMDQGVKFTFLIETTKKIRIYEITVGKTLDIRQWMTDHWEIRNERNKLWLPQLIDFREFPGPHHRKGYPVQSLVDSEKTDLRVQGDKGSKSFQ